jgi:hypothetical protein
MATSRVALTHEQQRQINDIVDELLSASEIKSTLLTPLEKIEANHPFITLHKCFHNPEEIFLRLEDWAKEGETKVGEVQQYVLEVINEQLNSLPSLANTAETFLQLGWNVTPENFKKDFKSIKIYKDEENEEEDYYNIKVEKEKIYKARLVPVPTFRVFDLSIEIEYPLGTVQPTVLIQQFADLPGSLDNDLNLENSGSDQGTDDSETMEIESENNQDEKLIENLKAKAKKEADQQAAYYTVEHFVSEHLIHNDETLKNALIHSSCNKILTHLFYISLLLNKKIRIREITKLTDEQADILLNERTIAFLRKGIINFRTAKQATHWGLEVLANHFYYNLATKDKSNIDSFIINDLIYVSETQGKMLLYPPTINLIKNQILPISYAKELPVFIKPVLAKYANFLLQEANTQKKTIDWLTMGELTAEDCLRLCKNPIFKLVTHHIIDITDIALMLTDQADLCHPKINDLLIQKKITIDQVNTQPHTVGLIKSLPFLDDWIVQGIIQFEEINPNDMDMLHIRIYTRRLFSLILNKPYSPKDAILPLFNEMRDAADLCDIDFSEFQDRILKRLAWKIKEHLTNEPRTFSDAKQTKIYEELIHAIHSIQSQKTPDWKACFIHLGTIADDKLKILSTLNALKPTDKKTKAQQYGGTLYPASKRRKVDNTISEICRQIIALSRFLKVTPEEKLVAKFNK